jgi:hypothetical protein
VEDLDDLHWTGAVLIDRWLEKVPVEVKAQNFFAAIDQAFRAAADLSPTLSDVTSRSDAKWKSSIRKVVALLVEDREKYEEEDRERVDPIASGWGA